MTRLLSAILSVPLFSKAILVSVSEGTLIVPLFVSALVTVNDDALIVPLLGTASALINGALIVPLLVRVPIELTDFEAPIEPLLLNELRALNDHALNVPLLESVLATVIVDATRPPQGVIVRLCRAVSGAIPTLSENLSSTKFAAPFNGAHVKLP